MERMPSQHLEHESRKLSFELPEGVTPDKVLVSFDVLRNLAETSALKEPKGKPSKEGFRHINGADIGDGYKLVIRKKDGKELTVDLVLSGSTINVSGYLDTAEMTKSGSSEDGDKDSYFLDVVIPIDYADIDDQEK